MGFDQYHEPPDELPADARTFAQLCASLTEEAEAIGPIVRAPGVEGALALSLRGGDFLCPSRRHARGRRPARNRPRLGL